MTWKTKISAEEVRMMRPAVDKLSFSVGLALTFAVLCFGCNRSSSHEVAHVISPNGSIEAILIETNGGATTSFGYDVVVKDSNKAKKVASLYGAVRNYQAYGVNLHWVGNNVLQVEYLRAKAVLNIQQAVEVNGKQVRIVLESGIEDTQAPAGGMLFNLQKQAR